MLQGKGTATRVERFAIFYDVEEQLTVHVRLKNVNIRIAFAAKHFCEIIRLRTESLRSDARPLHFCRIELLMTHHGTPVQESLRRFTAPQLQRLHLRIKIGTQSNKLRHQFK